MNSSPEAQGGAVELVELMNAVEAVLFAAATPTSEGALRHVFARLWADDDETLRADKLSCLPAAITALRERHAPGERGFVLVDVADGLAFRSNPRHADAVRALREERPPRLSKPALETLAIVAYRQPVTKPEVDTLRGVDCGGTLKVLLDRHLVRIVGKKEEVGRPLLYGTTADFLSLFNLAGLADLPSLREYQELNDASLEEVHKLDGLPSLQELSASAKQLQLTEEPAAEALQEAVETLEETESTARDVLAEQGIALGGEGAVDEAPAAL